MHPLMKYIQGTDGNVFSFATRVSMSQPTIWRIVNMKVVPDTKTMLLIQQKTENAVTVADMVAFYAAQQATA